MNLNDTSTKVILIGVVILTALIITGAVFLGAKPGTSVTATVNIKDVPIEGAPFIGKADAPVTIAEWSDYQCPACKQFETNALPQIVKDYVDTGKVKIVFKDLAFLGSDSIAAAQYERAVWMLYPEQFFAWRTAMYVAQDAEGDTGFGNAESIDTLNATVKGIDAAKVAADVKANGASYQTLIDADKKDATKFGIGSTPSFIVGTQLISGAYPYDTFKAAIDPLL
jgi:protein-disulfide isomerase